MKLLQPKFEILEQAPGFEGMLKQIEIAGRTCYRSGEKTTEGSAEKFVERMKSLGHGSVLEHGTVYLMAAGLDASLARFYANNYSRYRVDEKGNQYAVTNYRVLLQGNYGTWQEAVKNNFDKNWLWFLKYQCEPTEYHEMRVTVRFNTDIGISREFNRHRVNSISEESTRYCNYSKGKFDREISVVPPIAARGDALNEFKSVWSDTTLNDNEFLSELLSDAARLIDEGEGKDGKEFYSAVETWLLANLTAQWSYMRLTKVFGWSAQEARSILPLDTATELVHTAFVSDWCNFFKLRCDSHAHPMARELAIPLRDEFIKQALITDELFTYFDVEKDLLNED